MSGAAQPQRVDTLLPGERTNLVLELPPSLASASPHGAAVPVVARYGNDRTLVQEFGSTGTTAVRSVWAGNIRSGDVELVLNP